MRYKLSDNWQELAKIYEKTLANELDDILEEREKEEAGNEDERPD